AGGAARPQGGTMKTRSVYRALSVRSRTGAGKLLPAVVLVALVASGVTSSRPLSGRPGGLVPAALSDCGDLAPAQPAARQVAAAPGTARPAFQAIVRPTDPRPSTITYDGAKLVIKPSAVRLPVGIGITPLGAGKVPRLDPGMTNVTAKPRRAYRFTPHPMTFATDITV